MLRSAGRRIFQKKFSNRQALGFAIKYEMERDDRVFVLGEEVAEFNGAYKVTLGLHDYFNSKWGNKDESGHVIGPQRVLDTPITESGFTGIAVGAAMAGLRPICEFMTWNFSLQAIDQIVNSAAKGRYMSGGQLSCPIVFRGANGPSAGVGAQHSQCFGAWYSSIPGLKVVSQYNAIDGIGLMKAAIRDENPVVFLESELGYNEEFLVDDALVDTDFLLPIGKAHVEKPGTDITLVAHGRMVGFVLRAAQELEKQGVKAEVINLRSLRPLDFETYARSVARTGRLLVVENGWPQCGVGSEIIASIAESPVSNYLKNYPRRLTGADIPMPYSEPLELVATPTEKDIVDAVLNLVKP